MLSLMVKVLVLIVLSCHQIKALQLTDITVPKVADFRESAELSCSYEMGAQKLHSVKWYKNDKEFFRYTPERPNFRIFNGDGVTMDDHKNFNCDLRRCNITLVNLGANSSGTYRCEISGEMPDFKFVSAAANMTVGALPRSDPDINGIASSYTFDDYVLANCTSDKSSPATSLSWYINDVKAPAEYLQKQHDTKIQQDEFTLYYRSLEIRFPIDKQLYGNSKYVDLRCVARIEQYPRYSRENSARLYITSHDLNNEKLVNQRNSATAAKRMQQNSTYFFHIYSLIAVLFVVNLV